MALEGNYAKKHKKNKTTRVTDLFLMLLNYLPIKRTIQIQLMLIWNEK